MAKLIRNTPILYGKDAKQFLLEIDNLPSMEEREKKRARIEANVERLKMMVQKMKKHYQMNLTQIINTMIMIKNYILKTILYIHYKKQKQKT